MLYAQRREFYRPPIVAAQPFLGHQVFVQLIGQLPGQVVAALRAVIGRPDYRSRRCAMVVRGALARIQARRAVDRGDVMLFDDPAAARAWLLSAGRIAA